MGNKIIFVSGSKGGVGKSAVCGSAVDYLVEHSTDSPPLLVESDTSNPDIFKAYSGVVQAESLDLSEKDGWIQLLNFTHATAGPVIVNTRAADIDGVKQFGSLLMTALPELKRDLVTLWVINRQRDSLELLKQYREHINVGSVHVVRNLHWGKAEQFDLFNSSKIKGEVEAAGGKVVDFPDLADRVADLMSNKRMPISLAASELDFGERIELTRWRKEAHSALKPVLE